MHTDRGDAGLKDVAKSGQLSVLVSGDEITTGATRGIGGPTKIGVSSDAATLTDELAHALGNVVSAKTTVGNAATDTYTDLNEVLVALGQALMPAYEDMLRETAAKIGCVAGSPGCAAPDSPSK